MRSTTHSLQKTYPSGTDGSRLSPRTFISYKPETKNKAVAAKKNSPMNKNQFSFQLEPEPTPIHEDNSQREVTDEDLKAGQEIFMKKLLSYYPITGYAYFSIKQNETLLSKQPIFIIPYPLNNNLDRTTNTLNIPVDRSLHPDTLQLHRLTLNDLNSPIINNNAPSIEATPMNSAPISNQPSSFSYRHNNNSTLFNLNNNKPLENYSGLERS